MENFSTNDYFRCARYDIAELVPLTSKRILEVGAGFGELGRILSDRADVEIDAIEINPEASIHLKYFYRKHWIGDIENFDLNILADDYDCIIFPDVLEHLVNPWNVLRILAERLPPGGTIIASIPNVRNIGLLYRIFLQGRWDYQESGLLDRTHLRFFTRYSIIELIENSGLVIEKWGANRDNYAGFRKIAAKLSKLISSDMDICQFLVVARKI